MLEAGVSQAESPCGAGGRAGAITAGSRARNKKYNRFIRLNLEPESLPRQSAARPSRTALERLQGWRWQGARDGPGPAGHGGSPSRGAPPSAPPPGSGTGSSSTVLGVQLPLRGSDGLERHPERDRQGEERG